MQLIKAKVPCGTFRFPVGIWLTDRVELHAQILDVLYGPREPTSGIGSVEVSSERGRYVVHRHLGTGLVKIHTLRGRRPPHPRILSPGEFILGRTRAEEEAGVRARRVKPDLLGLRERDRNLAEKIERLERESSRRGTTGTAATGERTASCTDALAAVRQAVERLAACEAQSLRTEVARDRIIQACSRECRSPTALSSGSPTAAALEDLAREWRAIETAAACQRARHRKSFVPLLLAFIVAGGGMWLAGLSAGNKQLLLTGMTAILLPAIVSLVIFVLGAQRRRARSGLESALLRQARELLKNARILPPERELTSAFLMEAAHRTRSRDRIASLRESLSSLLPGNSASERRNLRLQMLSAHVDDAAKDARTALADEDPLLALPGLIRQLEKALEHDRASAARDLHDLGAKEAARAAACLAEAARLERHRHAIARVIRAHTMLEGWQCRSKAGRASIERIISSHRDHHPHWPLFMPKRALPRKGNEVRHLLARLNEAAADIPLVLTVPRGLDVSQFIKTLPPHLQERIAPLRSVMARTRIAESRVTLREDAARENAS